MKALLLSAYDAQSHGVWRKNIKAMFPNIEWVELLLPARYFPWRVRGNSLSWAFNHRDVLTDNYDLLLSTSMTDLSALRGFVPQISSIPSIVYFHENQFAYPSNPDPLVRPMNMVEPQILSLYTALCADAVVFNSEYNRRSFLDGASALLKKLPDHVPDGLLRCIEQASVIPVPLSEELFSSVPRKRDSQVLEIVWNHRWEYDKGPALLLAIVQELIIRALPFRLHLLGQRFRMAPPEFAQLQTLLDTHYADSGIAAGRSGFVDIREDYYQCLRGADVVLSTADHDFQGLSLLEACALGCSPLAPRRLVYPEYLPSQCLYADCPDLHESSRSAADILEEWVGRKRAGLDLPSPELEQFRQARLQDEYRSLFTSLLAK